MSGGQFDFVWLPARVPYVGPQHVWSAKRNQEKDPGEKCCHSFPRRVLSGDAVRPRRSVDSDSREHGELGRRADRVLGNGNGSACRLPRGPEEFLMGLDPELHRLFRGLRGVVLRLKRAPHLLLPIELNKVFPDGDEAGQVDVPAKRGGHRPISGGRLCSL